MVLNLCLWRHGFVPKSMSSTEKLIAWQRARQVTPQEFAASKWI